MFDNYSDGYCPQCALADSQVEMLHNQGDYWECPVCHLQAAGANGSFMILRERGNGAFRRDRVPATDYVVGAFVIRESAEHPLQSGGWFQDEADFRRFLHDTEQRK